MSGVGRDEMRDLKTSEIQLEPISNSADSGDEGLADHDGKRGSDYNDKWHMHRLGKTQQFDVS